MKKSKQIGNVEWHVELITTCNNIQLLKGDKKYLMAK